LEVDPDTEPEEEEAGSEAEKTPAED